MDLYTDLYNARGGVEPTGKGVFDYLLIAALRANQRLTTLNSMQAARISAAAFYRDSLAVARSSEFRIEALQKKIETDPEAVPRILQFLKAAEKFVREGNFTKPTANVRDYGFPAPVVEMAVELAALGDFSLLEVFALGVRNAVDSSGESFRLRPKGPVRDATLHQTEAELKNLQDRIGSEWSLDDVLVSKNRKDGRIRLTFKVSRGAVNVNPLNSAGERLIKWLVRHPEAL